MILGAQIGLLVYGIIVLIKGQYGMGKGKKVTGSKARLLGGLCLAPLPLSMIAGFIIGVSNPEAVSTGELQYTIAGVETAILVCTVTALIVLAKMFYARQTVTQ